MTEGMNILKGDRQLSILKALNFFSPRFSSFTIPAKREGFTDPFFRFLDFSDKNAKVP
jgi:hypothetical protein